VLLVGILTSLIRTKTLKNRKALKVKMVINVTQIKKTQKVFYCMLNSVSLLIIGYPLFLISICVTSSVFARLTKLCSKQYTAD